MWKNVTGVWLYSLHLLKVLLSINLALTFGIFAIQDSLLFILLVIHINNYTKVWTGNNSMFVGSFDKLVIDNDENAYVKEENGVACATNITWDNVQI